MQYVPPAFTRYQRSAYGQRSWFTTHQQPQQVWLGSGYTWHVLREACWLSYSQDSVLLANYAVACAQT